MNYIVNFANDPNSLTTEQINELSTVLINTVKNKISNLETKYNIKLKFPKNMCFSSEKQKLPLPIITPVIIDNTGNLQLFVPFDVIIDNSFNNNSLNTASIDKLNSCMQIVNTIKHELVNYEAGNITKEQIDTTYIDFNTEDVDDKIYDSEIEEMYNKKYGDDSILNNLIKKLEAQYNR